MRHSFKFTLSLATLALSSIAGCGSPGHACTEIACVDGIRIMLTGIGVKYAGNLPLTIKTCTGTDAASCITSTLTPKPGSDPICQAPVMAFVSCTVGANGAVEVVMPAGDANIETGKADVHVTITDSMNMVLFDNTTSTSITTSMPNGPDCEPTCHEGMISLTP